MEFFFSPLKDQKYLKYFQDGDGSGVGGVIREKIKVSRNASNGFKCILGKWWKHMENDPPRPHN